MNQIRVLIVEDDKDWLRGLRAYLSMQQDIQVVAAAATSDEALAALADNKIDVVLMDIMLASSMEGIWLTAQMTASSSVRVIMLTSMEEKELIFEAFQAGAVDYHIKSEYTSIPQAIRAAYLNRSPINEAVADRMREEFRRLKQLEKDVKIKEIRGLITPTELEVLKLIDKGYTQPEIAQALVVSIHTVKIHVGHILRKLGVGSSREAADKVREAGILKNKDNS
jgi:two-component system vancomycin resistance associated response regulator VraR